MLRLLALAAVLLRPAAAQEPDAQDDTLQLLAEEAKVVSASARPQTARRAPATVYVITGEELRASGAVSLFDALRMAPGVDVNQSVAGHGDVSIRGFNKIGNNRTLVMLDGKTVLNGFLEQVTWEAIPVQFDDIERVEIIEGPVSALYGPNAVQGAINIITKSPEQARGTALRGSLGDHRYAQASVVHGDDETDRSSKYTAGYRRSSAFSNTHARSSEVGLVSGLWRWTPDEDKEWSISGGLSDHDVRVRGAPAPARDAGVTGYGRADGRYKQTRARAFWNAGRTIFKDYAPLNDPNFDYDTYDVTLEQGLEPFGSDALTVGVEYRRNDARSSIFPTNHVHQDLYGAFFENELTLTPRLTIVVGGRLDHHPFTKWQFSPRGSLIFEPVDRHVFRFSAGTAFRNPTLTENYLDATLLLNGQVVRYVGATGLKPERVQTFEAAYKGEAGRVRWSLTGFHWTMRDLVSAPPAFTNAAGQLEFDVNNQGATRAVGYEAAVEAGLFRGVRAFANYSYQYLMDEDPAQTQAVQAPKHKVNAGLRGRRGPASGTIWLNWVDHELWPQVTGVKYAVPAYALLNLSAAWRFSGRLDGWELGVGAFNALNQQHYEMAPFLSNALPGQGVAKIGSRVFGTAAYRF